MGETLTNKELKQLLHDQIVKTYPTLQIVQI